MAAWKLLCHPKVSEEELDPFWVPQWAPEFSDQVGLYFWPSTWPSQAQTLAPCTP